MFFVARGIAARPDSTAESTWAIEWIGVIASLYVVAIVATIVLRFAKPRAGRIASRALNIILLFTAFPVGTAIGVYGLWKVDRG